MCQSLPKTVEIRQPTYNKNKKQQKTYLEMCIKFKGFAILQIEILNLGSFYKSTLSL